MGCCRVWQITFEWTKNMPLCSRADIIIFLPLCLLPRARSPGHTAFGPCASPVLRLCPPGSSWDLSFPSTSPAFFFLPFHVLRPPPKYIFFCSTNWHAGEPVFPPSAVVRRRPLRILNLPTIPHLNQLAGQTGAARRPLCAVIVLPQAPFSISAPISFTFLFAAGAGPGPPPPLASPLRPAFTHCPCFPERRTVNEMWHCHVDRDNIYQWMN